MSLGQGGKQCVKVFSRGRMAQRDAQRAGGGRAVVAHRQQHVRCLRDPRLASRASGDGDTLLIQQVQQRVALAAGERDVDVVIEPVHAIPLHGGARNNAQDALDGLISQHRKPSNFTRALVVGLARGGGKGCCGRSILRSATKAALLAATVDKGRKGNFARDHNGTDAGDGTDLVAGEAEGDESGGCLLGGSDGIRFVIKRFFGQGLGTCRYANPLKINDFVPIGGNRVDVQGNASSDGQLGYLCHRGNRSYLVIGPHHGDQCDVGRLGERRRQQV